MELLNCMRCGHSWFPRKTSRPERCARCLAKYWWRPKRSKQVAGDKQRIGRPNKYPVNNLNIGQTILLPWEPNVASMKMSIMQYQRRHGVRYEFKSTLAGLAVKRTL